MKERIKGRKNYPTDEVDPTNFISDEEVRELIKIKDTITFKQEDYYKLYNCVHCGECSTETERIQLKQKFLENGNTVEGLVEMIECFENYRTPYPSNKMRIKRPKGIPENSDTLFFMGCLSTIRIPRYTEHALQYLLKQRIDFTILDKEICCGYPILCTGEVKTYDLFVERNKKLFLEKGFEKIITVCPSYYMVFKKHYNDLGIKIEYFTEYLSPSKEIKTGDLIIQHACPLKHIEFPGIEENISRIYEKSGYTVLNVPHNCCGGGVGHQLRVDIAEKIALKRMRDFKEEGDYLSKTKEGESYITTYCPDAYWILKFYGRKQKIEHQLKDLAELLL